MLKYTLNRMIASLVSALFVATMVFFLIRVLPGDVTVVILGEDGYSAEKSATLRTQLGLDRPLPVQYLSWLGKLMRGEMGDSLITKRPVAGDLEKRFARTAELVFLAVPLGLLLGIPSGVIAALRRNTVHDWSISLASLLGLSVPNFILATFLVLLLSLKWGWLPSSGFHPFLEDPGKHLRLVILPTITLTAALVAVISRMMRSTMLEVLWEDYIRTARAKGLRERVVILKHGLRNALIPVIAVVGLEIGGLLAGAVVIESIFAWPGMGLYLIDGVLKRDLPVVQGSILLISMVFLVINLLVDLVYGWVDPRIHYV